MSWIFVFLLTLNFSFADNTQSQAQTEKSSPLGFSLASIQDFKEKFETNPFSVMTHEQLKELIETNTKGKRVGNFFETFPRLLDFTVTYLRDPQALPMILKIFEKEDRLKIYFYLSLGILILSFFAAKWLVSDDFKFFYKYLFRFLVNLFFSGITIILFLLMFPAEVSPSLRVIQTFWFY